MKVYGKCFDHRGGVLVAMVAREELYRKCIDGEYRLILKTKLLFRYVLNQNVYQAIDT